MSKAKVKRWWVTLAANPETKDVEICGLAASLSEASQHYERTKLPHFRSFEMGCAKEEMLLWFQSIGCSAKEARAVVVQVAEGMLKVLESTK